MSRTYRFQTTKREHLWGLGRFLVGGIDPAFFEDPCEPVIFTVRGSKSSGKKIIFDAARDFLLGRDASRAGREGRDEYYSVFRGCRSLCADFIDVAYGGGYSKQDLNPPNTGVCTIAENFLFQRTGGGLVVLQNDMYRDAWIDIFVDARRPVSCHPGETVEGWDRWVTVKVNHPALLNSPDFRARLEMLAQPQADVPVWGRNFPRKGLAA